MKKIIIIVSITAALVAGYIFIPGLLKNGKSFTSGKEFKKLPKVLFLTTGFGEGSGKISPGVAIALQAFNKRGAFVWLDSRDVLMQPEILSKYSIMVLPTSLGYHDGDKKYSLTYLSDFEMQNIINWVNNGGVLIAEENIGRNTLEDVDRVDGNNELNPGNWKLSELFGIKMKEVDMVGFSIEEKDAKIWNGNVKKRSEEDEWILVPTEIISDKIKVLAEWVRDDEKIPAIIENVFGKGKAILLTSTYLLHPSNDGGVSSIENIENFYDYILNSANEYKKISFELNPWPNGYSTAFCLSFNSKGNEDQTKRIENFLKTENISATFFIDSSLTSEQLKTLEENKKIILQSNLYSSVDLSGLNFSEMIREILMNEQHFGRTFTGFRFPLRKTNFWGLLYADQKGYKYDSSIGVDHLTNYEGTVIPYNIPVSQNAFYKTLNLLEISPASNDDEIYFKKTVTEPDNTDDAQKFDAHLFEKYLFDFYEFAVKKYNGLMLYAGHPRYTGYSEITLRPLMKLIDTLKIHNCWITTLDEVADFRNKLKDLSIGVSESENQTEFLINLPNDTVIKGLTIKLLSKPGTITFNESYDLKEKNGLYYLAADVKNGDIIKLNY